MKLRCLPDEPAGELFSAAWLLMSKRLLQSDKPTGDNGNVGNDKGVYRGGTADGAAESASLFSQHVAPHFRPGTICRTIRSADIS